MKTYRSVTVSLVGLILALLLIAIIFQPDNFDIPIIGFFALIFLVDAVFLINERKEIRNSRKYLFPLLDPATRKMIYYFLLVICIAMLFYFYFKNGLTSSTFIMFVVFGLIALRGIIFGAQSLEAIRIDNKYIEYGFGVFDNVKIASLKSYSIDYENKVLILKKEKKEIRIKIKYVEDIKKLDEVLKERIKT